MKIKKIAKIGILILIIVFIIIQFFRPKRFSTADVTGNEITKVYNVPENVQTIIKRSCFDCHSNHTDWPWYTNIAPVSWLVVDDVESGREKMNFSEWGNMSRDKQGKELHRICDNIKCDNSSSCVKMPLPKYLMLHKDKELSQEDKDIICKWTEMQALNIGE